jgi:tRNA-specific 2-thiouridylase
MRVVVAMSGGVDSSVAAALLLEQGHDVVGVSMQLYDQTAGETRFGSCCTIDDLHDARRVAAALGVPHYILNFERQFDDHVVSNFVREYLGGRTPIPCVRCNSDVKFATLAVRARALGAEAVATGHYARVDRDPSGRCRLRRGVDASRDQSYFLFSLDQAQLEQAVFPVGALSKQEVRELARRRGLPTADKPESREICFVPDHDYARLIERRAPEATRGGLITDGGGRVLGRHDGVHRFTVGQRKGLGLSSREPLYVTAIDAARARLVVGTRPALERRSLTASGVNWIDGAPPVDGRRVNAQIRYRHQEAPATARAIGDGRAEVLFDEPQTAVTPGQAVVFYDGDEVVGGGWIEN